MGDALGRLTIGSITFGIAAVVLGLLLKAPAMHPDAAASGSLGEPARIAVFGTVYSDTLRFNAPIGPKLADRIPMASLEPHTIKPQIIQPRIQGRAAGEQNVLAATPASGWWNESFDQRFSGAKTRELPSDLDFLSPSDDAARTAIYDIAARTVYLPNGRRLEAHSGLGDLRDNPDHVHVRMRGATPPNVYNLSLRKKLFHGVQAIRLTPLDESRMHGRDGILAHSFLHGPSGQSNGCVAFRNYPEFLSAFLNGEVARLIVVERLDDPPDAKVAAASPPAADSRSDPSGPAGRLAEAGN